MSTPTNSGVYYDINELSNLDSLLKEQNSQMEKIDKEKLFQNLKVLQYFLLLAGAVGTVFLFKKFINKK